MVVLTLRAFCCSFWTDFCEPSFERTERTTVAALVSLRLPLVSGCVCTRGRGGDTTVRREGGGKVEGSDFTQRAGGAITCMRDSVGFESNWKRSFCFLSSPSLPPPSLHSSIIPETTMYASSARSERRYRWAFGVTTHSVACSAVW